MTVVVDANLLVAYAVDSEHAPEVRRQLVTWSAAGVELHAPSLLPYEIASALTRYVTTRRFDRAEVVRAWTRICAITVTSHQIEDVPSIVDMGQRLERTSAYDAAYVILAQRLETQLWTLDARLARNARTRNLPVRLIGGIERGIRA